MYKVVERLDHMFSVRDIMTPADKLEGASSIEEARPLLVNYDVVPYQKLGRIEGFFQRGSEKLNDLKPEHLISDTTSLLNMPQLLNQAPFRFVLFADKIAGYVHFSDLNKPAMKVPLFVLFQAMEKKLWDKIENKITESVVHEVFQDNAQKLIDNRDNAIKNNVGISLDIGWIGIFTLPAILKLAMSFKETTPSDAEIKLLKEVRNNVSHADNSLIDEHCDVSKLVEALKLCQSMLKSSEI